MPRTCSICRHDQRDAVDAALASGTPYRDIAGRFAVSRSALDRHREHLGELLDRRAELTAEAVLGHLAAATRDMERASARARSVRDLLGLATVRLRAAETLGRLMGPMLVQELLVQEVQEEWPAARQDREALDRLSTSFDAYVGELRRRRADAP